jgi:hypothetical protein
MPESHDEYLDVLEMPEAIRERFHRALRFYEETAGMAVEFVHVTDRVDEEGNRLFENAWFFGGNYAMEAHDFVSKDDFDAAVVEAVAIWRVSVENYDFEKATAESRMFLTYNTGFTSGDLTATGGNCDSLRDVLQRFVIPRIAEQ